MPLPHAIVLACRTLAYRGLSAGLALGLSGAGFGAAQAQSAPPRPTPSAPAAAVTAVPAEPGVTTASYGDWVLRCQRLPGEGAPRLCEVSQAMQVQGQAAPVAQLAIGRLPGQDGLRVTVLLPTNVSFPSSVRVGETKGESKDAREAGKSGGQALELSWRRCIPGGCLADAAAQEAVLKGWRMAEETGRISFKDADGRELGVPVSFRGLGPALDALAKEKS